MGIFDRITQIFKANANSALDKMEDPEKLLEQSILDMKNQLAKAKSQVAESMAEEKLLEQKFKKEAEASLKWRDNAVQAVQAQRDDLAKQALVKFKQLEETALQYQSQYEAQKKGVEQLKAQLQELTNQIEEAERKKGILVARVKRAKAQETMAKTMQSITSNSTAFDTFSRMEKKTDQLEARASAFAELGSIKSSDKILEDEFKKLGVASGDTMLESLKAEMGYANSPSINQLDSKTPNNKMLEADSAALELETFKNSLKK